MIDHWAVMSLSCNNNLEDTYNKTRNIIVKEGLYHNTVNYTTLPNSSMTNDFSVSSSVITPMSPVVCTPVSLVCCLYTHVSWCVCTCVTLCY